MKKILAIICIVLVFGLLIISPFLIRVRIDCKSQFGNCPQQVLDKLQPYSGKSFYTAKKAINKTLKSEFLVSSYTLQFKLPATIDVALLTKIPVIAFKDNNSGSMILVDRNGEVLSEATASALPIISISGTLSKDGQNVGASDLFALDLAVGVNQMYQVENSTIVDGSLLVDLPGQVGVIFPLEGDYQVLLGSLRLIYSKIQSDGNSGKYSQVDLRFKNPVLR